MTYHSDYPKKPIGGGNPYYMCASCGISDPQINGRIEGHADHCSWRRDKQNASIFILAYSVGTPYVWGCDTAMPVKYESAEALIVDLEQQLIDGHQCLMDYITIGGVQLQIDDFYCEGKLALPQVFTLQEWYDSVKTN